MSIYKTACLWSKQPAGVRGRPQNRGPRFRVPHGATSKWTDASDEPADGFPRTFLEVETREREREREKKREVERG